MNDFFQFLNPVSGPELLVNDIPSLLVTLAVVVCFIVIAVFLLKRVAKRQQEDNVNNTNKGDKSDE